MANHWSTYLGAIAQSYKQYRSKSASTEWFCLSALGVSLLALAAQVEPVQAQVPATVDGTLGTAIAPGGIINTVPSDLVTGGTLRGTNLFHSFSVFNVLPGTGVYFSRPAGVTNILSRVTGITPSMIMGRLGVLDVPGLPAGTAPANLFLLNPNGIIFGAGASLDVAGSFVATTAGFIPFTGGGRFGPTTPTTALLTVQPETQFLTALAQTTTRGTITNNAALVAGQGITLASAGALTNTNTLTSTTGNIQLAGNSLTNSGTLTATTGAVTLNATAGTLQNSSPITAAQNLTLTATGALTNSSTLTSTASNLSLTGASISNTGTLNAPLGTVSFTTTGLLGGVDLGNYTGPSLSVNANGNITYGTVVIDRALGGIPSFTLRAGGSITGTGRVSTSILDSPMLVDFQAVGNISVKDIIANANSAGAFSVIRLNSTGGSVILDGARVAANNGGTGFSGDIFLKAATGGVIVRNGSSVEAQGLFGRIFIGQVSDTDTPAGRSATIDNSLLAVTNPTVGTGGLISISIPGTTLTPGQINIRNNSTLRAASLDRADGGEVNLTVGSRGQINLFNSFIDASISSTGFGGFGVSLAAPNGTVTLDTGRITTSTTNTVPAAVTATAGDITIDANQVRLNNNSSLNATTSGAANGGNISIATPDAINSPGSVALTNNSVINTEVQAGSTADRGGDISVATSNFSLESGSQIRSSTSSAGIAGNVELEIAGTASIAGASAQQNSGILTASTTATSGQGGNITINNQTGLVGDLTLSDGAFLSADTASGQPGGNIQINGNRFSALRGGQISATSTGLGQSGNISINTLRDINIANSFVRAISVGTTPPGQTPGNISFQTRGGAINVTTGVVAASNSNLTPLGQAGDIQLSTGGGAVNVTGNSTIATESVAGSSGSILLPDIGTLQVQNSLLSASTQTGIAGSVIVSASRSVSLSGSLFLPGNVLAGAGLLAEATRGGRAGDVAITTPTLSITNGARATVSSLGGSGSAGDLRISAGTVTLNQNGSLLAETDQGSGGNITLSNLANLQVLGNSRISASTADGQQGGTLSINASRSVTVASGGSLLAQATRNGNAGNLNLATGNLVINGGRVAVSSLGTGRAGNLSIAAGSVLVENAGRLAADTNQGSGGNISLNVIGDVNLRTLGQISTSTVSGQAGTITLRANTLGIDGDTTNPQTLFQLRSGIFSTSTGSGSAGTISINVNSLTSTNGGAIVATSFGDRGGDIFIRANRIFLFRSSPIVTSVFSETGNAGTIKIEGVGSRAAFFAIQDSDVLATAVSGRGGEINIDFPTAKGYIFIAENLSLAQAVIDPYSLRGNNRVDISGSNRFGASGNVTIPDLTFLISALNPLANNFVTSDRIIAGSCIARRNVEQGSFTVTGLGGLPRSPYDALGGRYDLVGVRSLSGRQTPASQTGTAPPQATAQPDAADPATPDRPQLNSDWKPGDPIREAQGMVTLPNGRIVLGTIGQIAAIAQADNLICHPAVAGEAQSR